MIAMPSILNVLPGIDTVKSSASGNSNQSPTDYNLPEYFEGLLSSVGAENEINRKYNSAEAAIQREWAAAESKKNRQWETEMSNSAYQRAVSDLKAAGLNPILAATGAASTPSGVISSGSSASSNSVGGDTLSSLITALANVASGVGDLLPGLSSILKKKSSIGFK